MNNKIPNVSLRLLENGETIFEDPLEEEIKLEVSSFNLLICNFLRKEKLWDGRTPRVAYSLGKIILCTHKQKFII